MTCRILLTISAATLWVATAAAQSETPKVVEPAPKAGVEVSVGAVLANNRGDEFDHRLAAMRRQFDSFFTYSSYRLIEEQRKRIEWGGKAGFDIPGGRYVLVMPREFKNQHVVMKVVVIDGSHPIVDTTVALRDRGTFLVGGQRQADGILIVAIGAQRVP